MSGGRALTLLAWVQYTGGCASGFVRAMIVNKESSYAMALVCASQALQEAIAVSGGGFAFNGTRTVSPNAWHHVAVTWDGATIRQYIDGAQVDERPLAGALARQATGLGIGCRSVTAAGDSGAGASFQGLLDEVAIYSRAWSAQEILSYYSVTR
jgi:hypothetical protein